MAIFDHNDFDFRAFYIPDDHSPSMADKSAFYELPIMHYLSSWGITAIYKKVNILALSIYGVVVLDYDNTPYLVISHIMFGNRNNPSFELENCETVLSELYAYIIKRLAWSTKCTVNTVPDTKLTSVSYIKNYNDKHCWPGEIIRPWLVEYSAEKLSENVKFHMLNAIQNNSDKCCAYRLAAKLFEPTFVTSWLQYGWDGPFLIEFGKGCTMTDICACLVDVEVHPGVANEDGRNFEILRYNKYNYLNKVSCHIDETYTVEFSKPDIQNDNTKGSTVVSISLNTEMLEFVNKHGNRSKFIQRLITDEMGREENVEHYKPILNKIQERIKCLPENQACEDDKTLPAATQAINTSSNGVFNLFLSKCLFLSKLHTTTEYTFRDWMAVFEHVTKIEEADRHFLNSDHKYKCLELTVRESSDWSPLLCDLAGGINILVSPTHDINNKNGVVYKCVALNSEVRRNAVIYSNDEQLTSTIRLLIIDRLSRDAGFEADSYPLDDAMKQATGNMKQASRKLLLEQLEKDIVIR